MLLSIRRFNKQKECVAVNAVFQDPDSTIEVELCTVSLTVFTKYFVPTENVVIRRMHSSAESVVTTTNVRVA